MRLISAPRVLSSSPSLPTHRGRTHLNSRSTTTYTVVVLTALYLLAFTYYHFTSARDPTSFFFDKKHAYVRVYSRYRVEQADAFIKQVNDGAVGPKSVSHPPYLCVGIATVARRGDQYLSTAVGSIVEGLAVEDRKELFLNVLLAHTDPHKHPNAGDRWLQTLPDRVLHYDSEAPDFERIVAWEEGGLYRNKTIYDYTYLLKNCYDTGAEYVAMIEDDTIAARDWYQRTKEALGGVSRRMRGRSHERWAYLRLFYVEDLLGWNSEEWPRYLFWSFSVWLVLTAGMLFAKKRYRRRWDSFSYSGIAIISAIFIPLGIGLHFMAGRQTVWPISTGVQPMNKYGCCSQALVFPRSIIPLILSQSDLTTDWLVDMMIEKIADKEHLQRWSLVPALFQHIGTTSSKGYGFDDNARDLWNFRFEDHPI